MSGPTPEQIERGRTIVFGYLVMILAISAGVATLYLLAFGVTARLPLQLVRVLLTAFLCFWTYRGSVPARWVMIALLSIGGGLSLIAALEDGRPTALLLQGGMALVYLSFVVVMVTARSVAAFLNTQRGKYGSV